MSLALLALLALLARLGVHQTDRATRTFRLCDDWCDSVYLALMRPAPNPSDLRKSVRLADTNCRVER